MDMSDPKFKRSLPIYTVDAFADEPFQGNPAAVCLLPEGISLPDERLQKIAAEMNLSDTAFVELESEEDSFEKSERFNLRWFTPTNEMALCGHATLASAAVLMFSCGNTSSEICFRSKSGPLIARRNGDMITLDFPLSPTEKMDKTTVNHLLKELCKEELIKEVEYSPTTKNLLVCLHDTLNRDDLENLSPDTRALEQSDQSGKFIGVVVTLKGSEENKCLDRSGRVFDFVSRYFVPWVGIPEDPVTGSTHTLLADYWKKQLNKTKFYARQCSKRGGNLHVNIKGDRVELSGSATLVIKGQLFI